MSLLLSIGSACSMNEQLTFTSSAVCNLSPTIIKFHDMWEKQALVQHDAKLYDHRVKIVDRGVHSSRSLINGSKISSLINGGTGTQSILHSVIDIQHSCHAMHIMLWQWNHQKNIWSKMLFDVDCNEILLVKWATCRPLLTFYGLIMQHNIYNLSKHAVRF